MAAVTIDAILRELQRANEKRNSSFDGRIGAAEADAKTFKDRLTDRRTKYESASNLATPKFTQALDNGVPLNPADVFGAFGSFKRAADDYVQPAEDQYLKAQETLNSLTDKKAAAGQDGLAQLLDLLKLEQSQANTDREFSLKEQELAQQLQQGGLTQKDFLDLQLKYNKEGKTIEVGENGEVEVRALEPSELVSKLDLSVSAKKSAAEYVSYLNELKRIKTMLDEETGGTASSGGILSDFMTGITGPLAQVQGQYGKGGNLRAALSTLESNIRNKMFGSALTDTEVREAKKFLPSQSQQESANAKRINQQIELKTTQLRDLLRTNGVPEHLIDGYIEGAALGYSKQTDQKTGGGDMNDQILNDLGF